MKHFVYSIKNKITNKFYIGITNNPKTRFKKHVYTLNTNCHHSRKLQDSVTKILNKKFLEKKFVKSLIYLLQQLID